MRKILVLIAWFGFCSAAAGDQSDASPKRTDSDQQIGLADAFKDDTAGLQTIKEDLKISPPFEVTSAFTAALQGGQMCRIRTLEGNVEQLWLNTSFR
jgi:hypothetical protein